MGRTAVTSTFTFTGTNGTNISADTTNWTEQNGSTGQLRILSNGFQDAFVNVADCCYKGTGTFTDDQYFELALKGAWGGTDVDFIGGTLRNNGGAFGSNTMYRVKWSPAGGTGGGSAQVFKVVNGNASNAGTQIGTNIAFAMTAGDLLSGEAVTNGANVDINVYKNGVLQGTRSDTSSVLTGGKPGITGSGGSGIIIGDDWIAGNVTSASFVGNRRTGLCMGGSTMEIGRNSGSFFRKNSWGRLVPAWSI